MNIRELIRKHLLNLSPYSSARDEYTGSVGVFLDANENPFGSAADENYNRYPDPLQKKLKKKISAIKGVSDKNIFLGNGSDEPIDLLIRAFCEPRQDNLIITPPTYGMYQVCAEINNIEVKSVPLTIDFDLDVNKIVNSINDSTKIIFLCSPNNPTGNCHKKEDILTILKKSKGLVVIDEAYIDYCEEPGYTSFLEEFDNLVVLQTLSKAWGLAALRLGMAFANEEVITILNKIKYPYNINEATQRIVLKALENEGWKNERVKETIILRDDLVKKLRQFDQVEKIYPSDANFILVKMKEAKKVFNYLIEQKIIVRDRSKVILCDGCLRITVGTHAENNQLIQELTKYFK